MSRDPSQDKNTTTPSNILDSLINLFKSNTGEPASTTRDAKEGTPYASPEDVEVLLAPPAPPPSPAPPAPVHSSTIEEDPSIPPATQPPSQPLGELPDSPSRYFNL